MSIKEDIYKQILDITTCLVGINLSVEQNYPSMKDNNIYITNRDNLSIALKNISYNEIYEELEKAKNYNMKLIDGGLIQFMYSFEENELVKAKLAFFPSPSLLEYQNNPEIYEIDEIYADMINKKVVTVPIRFDYDSKNFVSIHHSKSHLTLGQYENCRIPTYAPLTPNIFIDFILRNFYNTAYKKHEMNFCLNSLFENTIDKYEEKIIHINLNH